MIALLEKHVCAVYTRRCRRRDESCGRSGVCVGDAAARRRAKKVERLPFSERLRSCIAQRRGNSLWPRLSLLAALVFYTIRRVR